MRIVYLGTPEDAVPPLQALVAAGHDVAFVVTQPDRRRGRGSALGPSPVRHAAEGLGLEVRTPGRAREVVDDLRASRAELGVVVAFGQLLPDEVLEALPHGFVNVHFSLLPRWRGAAPVERAMMAGDTETGVCLMQLEAGLDTGPVYACERVAIGPEETAGELRARLVEVGTELLLANLEQVPGTEPVPQEGEPTYAHKLTVEEFELDWSRPADELARLVRAGNPRPGAWTIASGRRLKVRRARPEEGATAAPGTLVGPARVATGEGVLQLVEVQPEDKASMAGAAWAAGFRGERLGPV